MTGASIHRARSTSRDVAVNATWACPECPHPSPGSHEHTRWEKSGPRLFPTLQMCPARARGQVVSVTVPWPLPAAVVERAARALNALMDPSVARRAAEGQPDAEEEIARLVLTAALEGGSDA